MSRHIEVVSTSRVIRRIECYRARIELTFSTPKHQSSLNESLSLRDQVLTALNEAGLDGDQIEEGGGQINQSSWSASKTVTHQLNIVSADMSVLIQAMAYVEGVFAAFKQSWFAGTKRDFAFSEPTPEFADDPDAAETALKKAVANARRKATLLAAEAGVQLGDVIFITEEHRSQEPRKPFQTFDNSDELLDDVDLMLSDVGANPTPIPYSPASPGQGRAQAVFRVRFAILDVQDL